MIQPRKKSRKTKNIYTWIRQRTSPYCFGVKSKAGNPAHCNKNDDVKYHFQALRMGWWGRRLCRLKNAQMADHFAAKKTFYFTADGRSATREVLVNIDVDCHASGSLAGAIAFAEHLKVTRFPNLYFETSTNGNGVHGFFVVVKGDLGDEGLNSAFGLLDRWLKHELSKGDWDVENVEVKGHAPEFGWGREKFELRTYKSGQLAKLPREALTRAEELRGTTRIAVDELRRLKVPSVKESVDSVVLKLGKTQSPRSVVTGGTGKKVSGSITGRHFGEDELTRLKGSYLSLARELLGDTKLVATGRKIVTLEDLAVFLLLLKFFTLNMNLDGSLPTARWREMWTELHESGDIERAWCHHRFARMRNYLTQKDLLSWEDEDFVAGVVGENGQFIPGKAAKWRACEELMARMEEIEVQEVGRCTEKQDQEEMEEKESILYGCRALNGERREDKEEGGSILYGCRTLNGEQREGKEEGGSILYGCNDQSQYFKEDKEEGGSVLYGCMPFETPVLPPSLRQSESLPEVLDRLGIVIPLQKPRFIGYSTGQSRKAA